MEALLSIFKDIHICWCIFIHTHRQATRSGFLFSFFLKIKKKCSDFGKKHPDCVYIWVSLPWKPLVARLHWATILFAKHSYLKVWHCFEYAFVPVTAQQLVHWKLHQAHSEFSHIQNSIYSGIFKDKEYLVLLRHIHVHWDTVKTYSGLFRHIQHQL